MKEPPNGLCFVTDSLRADAVLGNETQTKRVDRLASEGVVFDQCLSKGVSMGKCLAGESLVNFLSGGASEYDIILIEKEMRDEDLLRFGFSTEKWTYLHDVNAECGLLYTRETDPEEQANVVDNNPHMVEQFRESLQYRLDSIQRTSSGIEMADIEDAPSDQQRFDALGYRK